MGWDYHWSYHCPAALWWKKEEQVAKRGSGIPTSFFWFAVSVHLFQMAAWQARAKLRCTDVQLRVIAYWLPGATQKCCYQELLLKWQEQPSRAAPLEWVSSLLGPPKWWVPEGGAEQDGRGHGRKPRGFGQGALYMLRGRREQENTKGRGQVQSASGDVWELGTGKTGPIPGTRRAWARPGFLRYATLVSYTHQWLSVDLILQFSYLHTRNSALIWGFKEPHAEALSKLQKIYLSGFQRQENTGMCMHAPVGRFASYP